MNKLFLSAALVSTLGLLTACAANTEDPSEETASESPAGDETAPEKTGTAAEAVMQPPAAEQVCCSNISGWGSVSYYQSWGGYGWVTTTTSYHQGGGCPSSSGTCQRVDPI